jgi:ubiquinol oxidase
MISTRIATRGSTVSIRAAAQLVKNNAGLRPCFVAGQRSFSTSPSNHQLKEFFEQKSTVKIHKTPSAWSHPAYTKEQMESVAVAHREAKTWSDKFALMAVKFMRFSLDTVTGYRHEKAVVLNAKDPEAARRKYGMTEEKYSKCLCMICV